MGLKPSVLNKMDDNRFAHVKLFLPDIIKNNLNNWEDVSPEIATQIKEEFVNLIPELGPVEGLKMWMGKDPSSSGPNGEQGYVARFIDRKYSEATILSNKERIWLLE